MNTEKFLHAAYSLLKPGLIAGGELADFKHYAHDSAQGAKPDPLAIAFPTSLEQVQELVRLCLYHEVKIVPSGGRTGYCGGANAENHEVVLSLEKMNNIYKIDSELFQVECGAGLITQGLREAALAEGLYYPVEFASMGSSQIGGNIASNAGGNHVIRYGSTRNWVQEITVVTGSGKVLDLGTRVLKDNAGYDLKQLLIGSEGTLGIITSATLRLTRPPGNRAVLFLGVESFHDILQIFKRSRLVGLTLNAFEFFCKTCKRVVVDRHKLKEPFAKEYSFYLIIEFEFIENMGLNLIEGFLSDLESIIANGVMSENENRIREIWAYRERISESLGSQFSLHKYDISIPQNKMPRFLDDWDDEISKKNLKISRALFGHIGDANLHLNVLKEPGCNETEFRNFISHSLDPFTLGLVSHLKGSISAEHGIGILKRKAFSQFKPREQINTMKSIKGVFDPVGILNPGKIFT